MIRYVLIVLTMAGLVGLAQLALDASRTDKIRRAQANPVVSPSEGSDSKGSDSKGSKDWTLFRGDPAFHAFRDIEISDKPQLLWTYDTGSEIESTAAIVGNQVYVGTRDQEFLALDLDGGQAKTGKLSKAGRKSWSYKTESGLRASASYSKGRLYFGDEFGFFYCLDAKTGKEVWKFDTEGSEIVSSAVFYQDKVIFGGYDAILYCLNTVDGSKAWTLEGGGPIHSTPVVVGNQTFVTGCDEVLRVVDLDSGKPVFEQALTSYTAGCPSIVGSTLYVGTFAAQVIAYDLESKKQLWTYEHPRKNFPFASSTAISGDKVVIGGRDKMIHCINRSDGNSIWTFPTRARVESSPVIVKNRVICGSSDKNLYMLDLDGGKEVWRYASDGAFVASAAIADGKLVIGSTNGLIYCFDLQPKKSPSP